MQPDTSHSVPASAARRVLRPAAISRALLGWFAWGALVLGRPLIDGLLGDGTGGASGTENASWPTLLLLGGIVAVIVVCAFGVVAQAEGLAHRLGDPYGTLVLTLSIVVIEVVLISAVMLGPGEHATIARDSVMAVSMIILNLVVGAALIVGGLRHGAMHANPTGASAYLGLLVVLLATALALPGLIGQGGSYLPGQAVVVAVLTVGLYGFFLYRQMGPQKGEFQEVATPSHTASGAGTEAASSGILVGLRTHRAELAARAALLLTTVIPIVLLSHDMAALLDLSLGRVGAPAALSGVLIAMIVFLPETITTIRAAHAGELQRVSNLCHGALVSTVGLTIPAVLAIGLATGQPVSLAAGPAELLLLGLSVLLTFTSFLGRSTTLHGAAHLALFALYGLVVFG